MWRGSNGCIRSHPRTHHLSHRRQTDSRRHHAGLTLQMEYPDFCARFDMDHEKAIASRKAILEQVKKEGWVMFGMHFPTAEGVVLK